MAKMDISLKEAVDLVENGHRKKEDLEKVMDQFPIEQKEKYILDTINDFQDELEDDVEDLEDGFEDDSSGF